ncbi:hypothetical protein KOW79_016921 [Hemibagrus wyckioides]|uniref:Uncharacterized protein n=1 Tax=Hemibagrus wyckioides TaxID=337641 RepID=A0A9D3NBB9_9TELE|nr:hypothetical protein KOW79_016921 [Hemibagrus wyckioides]
MSSSVSVPAISSVWLASKINPSLVSFSRNSAFYANEAGSITLLCVQPGTHGHMDATLRSIELRQPFNDIGTHWLSQDYRRPNLIPRTPWTGMRFHPALELSRKSLPS